MAASSSSSLEFNKIAAAVLIAGIVASFSGWLSRELIHPKPLADKAYPVPAIEEKAAPGEKGPTGPGDIAPLLAAATPQAGQDVAKKCAACHTFDKGGPNKIGPNLFGIVGAKQAHEGGAFPYSQAIASKGGTWTEEELNKFLWKPQAYAKGTKMTFAGLPKDQDRANVIKYLETLK